MCGVDVLTLTVVVWLTMRWTTPLSLRVEPLGLEDCRSGEGETGQDEFVGTDTEGQSSPRQDIGRVSGEFLGKKGRGIEPRSES